MRVFCVWTIGLFGAVVSLWRLALVGSLVAVAVASIQDDNNNKENEDDDDVPPHPDLNEENHDGMVFIGRLCHRTGRRLSADSDNTIRYVFGTSFVEDEQENNITIISSNNSEPTEILPQEQQQHWSEYILDSHALKHSDLPGQSSSTPTKPQTKTVTKRHRHNEKKKGLVPFGHVDTHALDGGVTPVRAVAVEPFWMDETPVTNQAFAMFVASTYYETEAEKYGWSFVLSSFVVAVGGGDGSSKDDAAAKHPDDEPEKDASLYERDPEAEHWMAVPGAQWRYPEGPGSSTKHRSDHPVVHVSHRDAAAYCAWRNASRLPGEREYEAAARASHWSSSSSSSHQRDESLLHWENAIHNRTMYAWSSQEDHFSTAHFKASGAGGSDPTTQGTIEWERATRSANLWGAAGPFPTVNDALDGWRGTSPVRFYAPNDAGVYDTTGNVWEWMRGGKAQSRILRGASYADSLDGSANHAATLGARTVAHGTTTTANIGFRCARSAPKRVQHQYQDLEEDEHGHSQAAQQVLAMEDQNHKVIPIQASRSGDIVGDDDEDDRNDEDGFVTESTTPRKQKRKRRQKVVVKPERISYEL